MSARKDLTGSEFGDYIVLELDSIRDIEDRYLKGYDKITLSDAKNIGNEVEKEQEVFSFETLN